MKKLLLTAALLVAFSLVAQKSFAACDATTTKETLALADKECDAKIKGEVCIIARTPPSCGKPGPAGAPCVRDKVCASGRCDIENKKCK